MKSNYCELEINLYLKIQKYTFENRINENALNLKFRIFWIFKICEIQLVWCNIQY